MVPGFHSVALPSGSRLQLVDFPGHERLRASLLQVLPLKTTPSLKTRPSSRSYILRPVADPSPSPPPQHIKGAKGMVVVVDPSSVQAIKQTALLLFGVFGSAELASSTRIMVKFMVPRLFHLTCKNVTD